MNSESPTCETWWTVTCSIRTCCTCSATHGSGWLVWSPCVCPDSGWVCGRSPGKGSVRGSLIVLVRSAKAASYLQRREVPLISKAGWLIWVQLSPGFGSIWPRGTSVLLTELTPRSYQGLVRRWRGDGDDALGIPPPVYSGMTYKNFTPIEKWAFKVFPNYFISAPTFQPEVHIFAPVTLSLHGPLSFQPLSARFHGNLRKNKGPQCRCTVTCLMLNEDGTEPPGCARWRYLSIYLSEETRLQRSLIRQSEEHFSTFTLWRPQALFCFVFFLIICFSHSAGTQRVELELISSTWAGVLIRLYKPHLPALLALVSCILDLCLLVTCWSVCCSLVWLLLNIFACLLHLTVSPVHVCHSLRAGSWQHADKHSTVIPNTTALLISYRSCKRHDLTGFSELGLISDFS